jgi:hypothetical protein
VNDIEASDPPRHQPHRHLRGPGRKALAVLVLSDVALVIFGRLTPVDAAGDRRCRRNRRGGPSVPTEN